MDTQKNNVESDVYSAHHDVASLNLVPFVRHEVACVFIKEIREIRRSAAGTLPGRASGVTPRCEASGTR